MAFASRPSHFLSYEESFQSCLDELMADDSRGYAIEFEANLGKLRFV